MCDQDVRLQGTQGNLGRIFFQKISDEYPEYSQAQAEDTEQCLKHAGSKVLRSTRAGQHSIRINDQYRICFIWRQGEAYRVEIVDDH